jgi:hypothetical protein
VVPDAAVNVFQLRAVATVLVAILMVVLMAGVVVTFARKQTI